MTFEQLDYFITAVESDTFFDAAETLHITQSTLSKQMKKIEAELDLTLWDRTRRSAKLTSAGEVFYQEAKNLSKQYHKTLIKMQKLQEIVSQELHIGTLPFLAQYNITERIRQFQISHPEIKLKLSEVEEKDLLAGLSNDTFDFVIARKSMIAINNYCFHVIAQDTLCVILPENHPLAKYSILSIEDIKMENFILMHPYTSIYQLCETLFTDASIHPNIVRTARVESIINAVQFDEGIGLFPKSNLRLFQHKGIVAIPLSDAPQLEIGITYKESKKLFPVIRDFLEIKL